MSNHFSADNLRFPGDDARLDLTDVFVFAAHDDQGKTVLVMNSNPFMTGSLLPGLEEQVHGNAFHPDAVYRINIATGDDLHADAAFTFVFSPAGNGSQTMTAYYVAGDQARQPEPAGQVLIAGTPVGFDATARPAQAGPVRLFAGVRSDPFFADIEGALHGFVWTG